MFEQESFSLDCGDMLQNARRLQAAEGKRFRGRYRGTTMETNKRDWNSVGKSSKKSQVRQTDQVWYHDDMDESSLARAIHASTSPLHENMGSGKDP